MRANKAYWLCELISALEKTACECVFNFLRALYCSVSGVFAIIF
jgi:hypothetical protein